MLEKERGRERERKKEREKKKRSADQVLSGGKQSETTTNPLNLFRNYASRFGELARIFIGFWGNIS
jgi:hypothetical protein